MEIRRLEPTAAERYLRELWVPYMRELEEMIQDIALASELDLNEELAFQRARLDAQDHCGWVAVADETFVGFVIGGIDAAPVTFERPDRLEIADLYVRPQDRGTGVAEQLIERALEWGRSRACDTAQLTVDVDNDRAMALYERLGFEPARFILRRAL